VRAAKAKDQQEAVARTLAGAEVDEAALDKHERKAAAKLAVLRRALPAFEQAVDEAGNAMLGPIAEGVEGWASELDAEAAEAAARYEAALAEARAALDELGRARSAVEWLRDFDQGAARTGKGRAGMGRSALGPYRSRISSAGSMTRELLTLAAKASAGVIPSLEERREAREVAARLEREAEQAEYRRERQREEATRV
jgi:hypothetical protein